MMKFYNKVFPSSYHELITFYPRFYRDVLEMDAILRRKDGLLTASRPVLSGFFTTALSRRRMKKPS